MLSQEERSAAAPQWIRWWRALVNLQVRSAGGYATPRQAAWRDELDPPFEDGGSWPHYDGLADRPAPHKAVLVSLTHTDAWLREAQDRAGQEEPDDHFELARSLAEATIVEHGVSPDTVRALVIELLVPDQWWSRWSPGVVVAGSTAMRNSRVARSVLQSAYWSCL
jgi:hypothetical protein